MVVAGAVVEVGNDPKTMNIKKAIIGDEKEIQSLILRSVDPENNPDFDEEGQRNFIKPNELSAIIGRILDEEYLTLCCFHNEKIVGLIAVYQNEKLDQLFVDTSSRNKGVSKLLWQAAKRLCEDNGSKGKFWVKSSTMAIPVYESFGFKLTSGRQKSNGIVYYSMVLE